MINLYRVVAFKNLRNTYIVFCKLQKTSDSKVENKK